MRARVIQNAIICGIHYLGFVLETEKNVSFTLSQTGRSFRHSDGDAMNGELADLLQKVRDSVGAPNDTPARLPFNSFAGQVIDLPDELLK